jgi:hypothetical protein
VSGFLRLVASEAARDKQAGIIVDVEATPPLRTAELLTPFPNRFVADRDPAFGHHFFDVTKTQAESKVQPHGVADDLSGKAMAFVRADR